MKLMVNKKKLINIILLGIIVAIINIIPFENVGTDYYSSIMIVAWITNIFYFIFVSIIYKVKKNILDFNIIFLVFIFLFCFGQVFLYSLGISPTKLYLFNWFGEKLVLKASIYFLLFSVFYMIGVYLNLNYDNMKIKTTNDEFLNFAIRRFAYFLLVISIVPFFYILLPTLYNSIAYGYIYNFNNAIEVTGFNGYLSKFFIPSLFLLLYSYRNDKTRFKVIISSLVMICIMYLIRGSKGSGLTIIVGIVVFYSNFIKKISGVKILKIIPLLLIILFIIPLISNYRGSANKDLQSFSESISETINNSDNLFVNSISEMGGTMQAFIYTYKIVPSNYKFGYGKSYLSSFMMIIPSFIIGTSVFSENAALDTWLMKTCNLSFGPGYSIVAEVYYNFGWYGGLLFSILLGLFFTKMFHLKSKNETKMELLKLLSFIFLFNSMTKARFPFHETIRNVFYMYFIFYFIIINIYNKLVNQKGDNHNEDLDK